MVGQDDDQRRGRLLFDGLQDIESAPAGHGHVQNQDGRQQLGDPVDGFCARFGHAYYVESSELVDQPDQSLANDG